MADFSQFLRRPAGEAKKASVLFATDYPGTIKSFETGDQNKNKTPYVRFHLSLTGFGDAVPESWEQWNPLANGGAGGMEPVQKADVDLSKRQLRRDFFLTDDALWRLDDLIRSCGIDPTGRVYEEVLPELQGAQVLIEVQQYTNEKNGEVGNQVGKLVGLK